MNSTRALTLFVGLVLCAVGCDGPGWPPTVADPESSPVLSPDEALRSIMVPPGFRVELVAAEPLVEDPVAMDIDPDGRLYAAEMRGWMTSIDGEGALEPVGKIAVVEDTDGDGRMDRRTVFLDSLVSPNAVKVLSDGVLVSEPNNLWFARDLDGDLVADEKVLVSDRFGIRKANMEANANGFVWGLDNWIHTTDHDRRYRILNGRWVEDSTLAVGQFGLAMDDYGRMYRNDNSRPVFFDYVPPHYFARNPNLPSTTGIEEDIANDSEVWPIRTTPGANRGYQTATLREDGRLRTFTAACGPGVYRGHTYPSEFTDRVNIFVAEPVGNLVHRYVLEESDDGTVAAVHGYDGASFVASTDERFRPVNTYSGPDGSLYLVDMYRGIIEHRDFITTHLMKHIQERNLEEPLGMGRIYRVVYEDSPSESELPRLTEARAERLVEYLGHPNGWWRDTAQRLLVERGDTSVASALRAMAVSREDPRIRLHALWTLEGLGRLKAESVRLALDDDSPHVRVAAVAMAEPWLRRGTESMLHALRERIDDPSPPVRLQLAASFGEAPAAMSDSTMIDILSRHGGQKYVLETVVSGMYLRELALLEKLLQRDDWKEDTLEYRRAISTLASAVVKAEDAGGIDRVFGAAADTTLPQWQRLALLDGVENRFPSGGGVILPLELPRRPTTLDAVLQTADAEIRDKMRKMAERLSWPGKPGSETWFERLTPEAKERYEAGQEMYQVNCAFCHGKEGEGEEGLAVPLVGSEWVHGTHQNLTRILLQGKEGELGLMPPQNNLTDEEIASILTYIRNAWGNRASPVTPGQAADVRLETAAREMPWTDPELEAMVH